MYSQRPVNFSITPLRASALAAAALGLAAVLTGCAGNMPSNFGIATSSTGSATRITGVVHGGQNPVSGAAIQLYTVGTTGLQSASTGLISSPPLSGPTGGFTITGLYNGCNGATPGTEVYLVATGGNPGGGTNANLSLAAALGSCAYLAANAANISLNVNEVTTVAAAYALAPFAADFQHIGASGSFPTGLMNAFNNATVLASNTTGAAGGDNLPSGVTVPVTEINTLANIIATCVNSQGTAGGSAGCASIFGATGATDTFSAAIAMAHNPSASAVTALYNLSNASAPFQPSMTSNSAPNDFSVAISIANANLATPYAIALDASGNAFVTNESGSTISEFSAAGTALTSIAPAGLVGAKGIAVSRNGVVWVANTAGNSAYALTFSSGTLSNTATYPAATFSLSAPSAVAVDSAGNAFFTNFNGNSVTGISAAGALISGSPFTGNSSITVPSGIALDTTGNLYVTSGSGSIIELTNAGAYSAALNDGALQGPISVALDGLNRVYATGFTTGTSISGALSEFSGGTASAVSPVAFGLTPTLGVATDGSNAIWVVNNATNSGLFKYSYGAAQATAQFASGSALVLPVGVAVDSSGSIWVTNSGNNTVTKFIGLATPVITPMAANVGP